MARPLTDSALSLARGRTGRKGLSAVLLAGLLIVAMAPGAQAATATNAWLAKIGSAGANGTAALNLWTTGTGNTILKLKKLPASKTLAVTLLKASCKGSTLLTLASVKTTSTGVATRTITLTASQATAIRKATTGTAKIAVRIGTGTTAKCGLFAAQVVRAYVAGTLSVGQSPSGVAVDATGVWVTNWWDNTLSRINPATNTVQAVVQLALTGTEGPEAITTGAGSLWVTTTEYTPDDTTLAGSIVRIDPTTGTTQATIPGGRGSYDIAFGFGSIWVPNFDDNAVVRIDPATNQVVATVSIIEPSGIAVDANGVWVVDHSGNVVKIDPATNMPGTPIHTLSTGGFIAAGGGSLWVTNPGSFDAADGSLSRINSATGLLVGSVTVGARPQEVVYAGGSVWVGLGGASSVVRVNPANNTVMSTVTVSSPVYSIDATDHAVWVVHNLPFAEGAAEPPNGTVTRIGY